MAVTGTHQFGTGAGTVAPSGMATGYARGGYIKSPRSPRMPHAPKPSRGKSKSFKPPRQSKPPQASDDQDRSPNIAPPPDQPYAQPGMPYAQPDMPYAPSPDQTSDGSNSAPDSSATPDITAPDPSATGYARGGGVKKRRPRSRRRFQEDNDITSGYAQGGYVRRYQAGGPVGAPSAFSGGAGLGQAPATRVSGTPPSPGGGGDTSGVATFGGGAIGSPPPGGTPISFGGASGGAIGSPPPGGTPTSFGGNPMMSGGASGFGGEVIGSPPPGGMPTTGTMIGTGGLSGGAIGSPPLGGAPSTLGAFGAGSMMPGGSGGQLGGGMIGSPPPGGAPTRGTTSTPSPFGAGPMRPARASRGLPGGAIGSPPPGGGPTRGTPAPFGGGRTLGGDVIGSPPPNSAMYLSGLGPERPTGYARGGFVKGYQDGGEVEDDDDTAPDYSQPALPAPGVPEQADQDQGQQDDSWWSAPQRVLRRMHDAMFSPAEAAEAPNRPRAAPTDFDESVPDYSQSALPAPGTPTDEGQEHGQRHTLTYEAPDRGQQQASQESQDRGLVGQLPQWFRPDNSLATGFLNFLDPNRRAGAWGLPFPGRNVSKPPPPQPDLPDNSMYRTLAGDGAPSRDYVENNLNNIMQANPGMSLTQAVHKFVADPEVSGQPDLAEQHMQGARGMQLERLAIGRVEYDNALKTNNPEMMDTALQRLSEAHDYVPDGRHATYTRDPNSGDILASVDGGQPVRFSPRQFGEFIHGPGMQFDHLMINGVENHQDMGSNHGKPAGEVAQGGQQAAQSTGYGASIDLRNMTPASRAAISKAQIVMGLKPGTTQGLPTGYAAGQAQAPSAADYDEGKRLGLTDREAQLRAEIMQTRASGRSGPVNWNEIAPPSKYQGVPTDAPQPPRLTGPVAQQYAMFGGGATTGDPNRISSQYFNSDEKDRVWSTIPAQQNPAQAFEQALSSRQAPAPAAQAQAPWRSVYGRGTAPVPPPADDRSLEATLARQYPGTSQGQERQQALVKGQAAQAAGAEKERLVAASGAEKERLTQIQNAGKQTQADRIQLEILKRDLKDQGATSIDQLSTEKLGELLDKSTLRLQHQVDAGVTGDDLAPFQQIVKGYRDEQFRRMPSPAPAPAPAPAASSIPSLGQTAGRMVLGPAAAARAAAPVGAPAVGTVVIAPDGRRIKIGP